MQDNSILHIAYKYDYRNFSDIYKFNDVLELFTKKTLDTNIFFNFLYSLKEPDAFHIKRKELIDALKQIQEHEKNESPFIELNGKRFNFSNSHLKFDEADLIEDELSEVEQEVVADILNDKKIDETVLSKLPQNTVNRIKKYVTFLLYILGFFLQISELLGIEPSKLLGLSPSEFEANIIQFCAANPNVTQDVIGIREVDLTRGLNLRKYDRKNAPVLAQLDNGTRICVLSYPKGNSPWLKVAVKNDNGETLVGYVSRKYTKKINIVITK